MEAYSLTIKDKTLIVKINPQEARKDYDAFFSNLEKTVKESTKQYERVILDASDVQPYAWEKDWVDSLFARTQDYPNLYIAAKEELYQRHKGWFEDNENIIEGNAKGGYRLKLD